MNKQIKSIISVLVVIIMLLTGYIVYFKREENKTSQKVVEPTIIETTTTQEIITEEVTESEPEEFDFEAAVRSMGCDYEVPISFSYTSEDGLISYEYSNPDSVVLCLSSLEIDDNFIPDGPEYSGGMFCKYETEEDAIENAPNEQPNVTINGMDIWQTGDIGWTITTTIKYKNMIYESYNTGNLSAGEGNESNINYFEELNKAFGIPVVMECGIHILFDDNIVTETISLNSKVCKELKHKHGEDSVVELAKLSNYTSTYGECSYWSCLPVKYYDFSKANICYCSSAQKIIDEGNDDNEEYGFNYYAVTVRYYKSDVSEDKPIQVLEAYIV